MSTRRTKLIAFPFAAMLTSGVLAGCADETVVQEAEEDGPVAEAAILGETVTLQVEVTEVVGPNSFTVGEDDTLVVAAAMADALEEGAEVQVTGTVRSFVLTDVETDLGIDFDEDEETVVIEYEQELIVVADDVQTLP